MGSTEKLDSWTLTITGLRFYFDFNKLTKT